MGCNLNPKQLIMDKEPNSNQHNTFFKQFTRFSRTLNQNILDLKKEFQNKPGSYPQHYEGGMNVLRSEIEMLKKSEKEVEEKMKKVLGFDHFLTSTKELLCEVENDVVNLETYLARFGYVVIVEEKTLSKDTEQPSLQEQTEAPTQTTQQQQQSPDLFSPELSEVGRRAAAESHPALSSPPATGNSHVATETKMGHCPLPTTPAQRSARLHAWDGGPTPSLSARKRVETWIEGVEARAAAMEGGTPQTRRQQSWGITLGTPDSPLGKQGAPEASGKPETARHSRKPQAPRGALNNPCAAPVSSLGKVALPKDGDTPEEPTMSSRTTLVSRGNPASNTPEEPPLSTLGKSLMEPHTNGDNHTPEEPQLLNPPRRAMGEALSPVTNAPYRHTPLRGSPESPMLSDITQKILGLKQMRIDDSSEKENTTPVPRKPTRDVILSEDFEPMTPELSETTRKFLFKK